MNYDIVCPICDFKKSSKFFVEIVDNELFTIVKCQRCGLVYTLKSDIFREQYYMKSKREYQKVRSTQYVKELLQTLLHLKTFIKQNSLLIDIGCSTGFFLDLAKKCGFRTEGVEKSEIAAEKSLSKGHKVFTGDILEVDIPLDSVDVVVLLHTLEHLSNPDFVIEKIRSVLKKNGIIIVEVPNLWHWILQRKFFISRSLAPDRHLYHFTPVTLTKLVEICGLKVMKIMPANRYDKKNAFTGVFQFAFSILAFYIFVVTGIILSNSIRLCAQKK